MLLILHVDDEERIRKKSSSQNHEGHESGSWRKWGKEKKESMKKQKLKNPALDLHKLRKYETTFPNCKSP